MKPIITKHSEGLPLLQWANICQTAVIGAIGGRGRVIIARAPEFYEGPNGEYGSYSDGWCYDTLVGALIALAEWDPTTTEEPDGWVKQISTGRRRLHGRADLEYRTVDEEAAVRERAKEESYV